MNLDEFINFIIPLGLVVVFFAFIYYKFREPFRELFKWLGNLFSSGKEKTRETIYSSREIVYDI